MFIRSNRSGSYNIQNYKCVNINKIIYCLTLDNYKYDKDN